MEGSATAAAAAASRLASLRASLALAAAFAFLSTAPSATSLASSRSACIASGHAPLAGMAAHLSRNVTTELTRLRATRSLFL